MSQINTKGNDLEILWVEPQSSTDARVPTAQELAASSHLHQQNLKNAQRTERPGGIRNRPVFAAAMGKGVVLPAGLVPYAPGHPSLAVLTNNVTVQLPALADTVSIISRYDYVSLVVFGVVVNAAIDPDINLPFTWRNQSNVIQMLTKENTQRIRSVWAIVCGQGVQTFASAIYSALGTGAFTVSKAVTGVALSGGLQLYPLDPNLLDTKTYTVVQDTIEVLPLLRVWRVQNYSQNGYVWGQGGEADFVADFHLQPAYRFVGENWRDWYTRSRETMRRVFLGLPLPNSPAYDRAVQNLLNGQVGTNTGAPGISTASPNGSTALANGQRTTFANQSVVQKTYCAAVLTQNSGGLAQASVPFQVNSPAGSYFSQSISDHKVYTATGRDVTLNGSITGLGGTGALIWIAADNTIVAPGDQVFVVPGIRYPAGSGFPVSGMIEKVFLNGLALNTANVLEASQNDISAYQAPAAGESFIAVLGKERAALHYLYKKLTITSTSAGVVAVPASENGVIAFISGTNAPTGRVDAPVITGLTPSTNYSVLIYYPPKATENWQFQFKISRYAGSQEKSWLNGAQVATPPLAFAHTQGGGNSVFLADQEVQYELLSFRLPVNALPGAVPHYLCNYRILWQNETDNGSTSFREIALPSASALVAPTIGQKLTAVDAAGSQVKGIAAALQNEQGQALGILKRPIQCSQVYQLVIAFIVWGTDNSHRLLVIALNGGDVTQPSSIAFNSDAPNYAAIDTFQLY